MDSVVALCSVGVPGLSNKKDDDTVDRLSSRYTVIMILVFSAIITLQLYLGSPLTCWAPVHFTYSHMTYANSYCWIKNTYYLPFEQQIPRPNSTEHANRQVIPYYQWIPFILILQAVLFYIPSVVWHGLNQQGGIDADNILQENLFPGYPNMDSLVALASAGVPGVPSKRDDDTVDRLSSRYTVIMILVFSAVITLQLYVGSPLTCWHPMHFTGSHVHYANSYCWVKNTYYLPLDQNIPKPNSTEHTNRQVIPYYQWIPFILIIQAVLFYIPSVVWHGLNQQGGIDADNILQAAGMMTLADKEEQRNGLKMLLTNQIDRFLGTRRKAAYTHDEENIIRKVFKACCGICGRRFGAYLVILYSVTKILYIINVIAQFFILNSVLGTNFSTYGFQVMQNMVKDDDWTSLPHVVFPRVTMCDFNIRRLGNLHRYTLQCALRINMYNEKIYVFLWFWFFLVALLSVLSTLVWFMRFILKSDRRTFISNHLQIRRKLTEDKDWILVEEFVFEYLKQDGVFLLRLISHNTNNIVTTELVCSMWESFKVRRQKRLDEAAIPPTTTLPVQSKPAATPSAPGNHTMEKKPLLDTLPVAEAKIENEKKGL